MVLKTMKKERKRARVLSQCKKENACQMKSIRNSIEKLLRQILKMDYFQFWLWRVSFFLFSPQKCYALGISCFFSVKLFSHCIQCWSILFFTFFCCSLLRRFFPFFIFIYSTLADLTIIHVSNAEKKKTNIVE